MAEYEFLPKTCGLSSEGNGGMSHVSAASVTPTAMPSLAGAVSSLSHCNDVAMGKKSSKTWPEMCCGWVSRDVRHRGLQGTVKTKSSDLASDHLSASTLYGVCSWKRER